MPLRFGDVIGMRRQLMRGEPTALLDGDCRPSLFGHQAARRRFRMFEVVGVDPAVDVGAGGALAACHFLRRKGLEADVDQGVALDPGRVSSNR